MSATAREYHKLIVYTDGGARGNPGPAAIGYALYWAGDDGTLREIERYGEKIGYTTNNQAEYRAVIHSLTRVLSFKPTEVEVRLDSELVGKQLCGEYRVKDQDLKPLYARVEELESKFEKVSYLIIPRELNKEADMEVNRALDLDK